MSDSNEIRTFSGTHGWDSTVLVDTNAHEAGNADEICENIAAGICPRCEGPLPKAPEYPAGSRITKCRSIPICARCGSDELYEVLIGDGLSDADCWPLSVEGIERRKAWYEAHSTPATMSGGVILTEDGVAQIRNPRDTGGWAQYGFTDEDEPPTNRE